MNASVLGDAIITDLGRLQMLYHLIMNSFGIMDLSAPITGVALGQEFTLWEPLDGFHIGISERDISADTHDLAIFPFPEGAGVQNRISLGLVHLLNND
jgi:hypothetical protein